MKIAIVIFLIVCVVITILDYLIIVGGNMNKSEKTKTEDENNDI